MTQTKQTAAGTECPSAKSRFVERSKIELALAEKAGLLRLPSVNGPYLAHPKTGEVFAVSGTLEYQKALGHTIEGIPSDELKAQVLGTVYRAEGIKVLSGFDLLAASHRTTNVGIIVVAGNFCPFTQNLAHPQSRIKAREQIKRPKSSDQEAPF